MSTARITYTRVTPLPDGTVSYTQVHETDYELNQIRNRGMMHHFSYSHTIYHWDRPDEVYFIRNVIKITENKPEEE